MVVVRMTDLRMDARTDEPSNWYPLGPGRDEVRALETEALSGFEPGLVRPAHDKFVAAAARVADGIATRSVRHIGMTAAWTSVPGADTVWPGLEDY
jgi:hypothetical protein